MRHRLPPAVLSKATAALIAFARTVKPKIIEKAELFMMRQAGFC